MEYSNEEREAARLKGLDSPSELYSLAVINQVHHVYHMLADLSVLVQAKVDWPDDVRARFAHIINFFVQDLTNALADQFAKKPEVSPDDSSSGEPNDSGNV